MTECGSIRILTVLLFQVNMGNTKRQQIWDHVARADRKKLIGVTQKNDVTADRGPMQDACQHLQCHHGSFINDDEFGLRPRDIVEEIIIRSFAQCTVYRAGRNFGPFPQVLRRFPGGGCHNRTPVACMTGNKRADQGRFSAARTAQNQRDRI